MLLFDLEQESSNNFDSEEVISVPRNRASHCSKRLVHNLESALTPVNHDETAEVTTQKLFTACLEKQKNYTNFVTWSSEKQLFIDRQSE